MRTVYVARLYEGGRWVRSVPLPGSPVDVLQTPRLVSPRFDALEAEVAPRGPQLVEVDRWRWNGGAMFATLTTEAWLQEFGSPAPIEAVDFVREQVEVCWLRFFRV